MDYDELLIGITLARSAMGSSLVVWKDGAKNIRPLENGKRLRHLKPGDQADVFGEIQTIRMVEVYR